MLKCRYCYNVAKDEQQQLRLCKSIMQKWMNLCNGRSSDGSPLPKYEEIIGLIKSEVQSFGLSDVGLYLGDCFAGVRANSDSAMEKRLKTVEQAQEELQAGLQSVRRHCRDRASA